ncbi:c-type cytochrome [Azospira restricta]|uniref:C-type cytochrome n=1 Tax=Azospira restricta TaxID=404405 RepID=A0A974PX67_9RHOO|nr:c-type cytochrome [Azospira restricta]QRJ63087.1 c-type cytochrome [Azospira restricta]
MHYRTALPLLLAAAVVALPAQASEAIAKKARCIACHAVDKKMVGPAYREVAAKYRGDASAPARLADKVRQGGGGVWGQVPMMPHPADKIGDEDLKAVIAWVLALE